MFYNGFKHDRSDFNLSKSLIKLHVTSIFIINTFSCYSVYMMVVSGFEVKAKLVRPGLITL